MMKNLLFSLSFGFLSVALCAQTPTFTSYGNINTSEGNCTIRVYASASTPFGKGISGGLSLDGGSSYPYGWGPFVFDSYDSGSGVSTFYRDFTLPCSSTGIDGQFAICDYNTNNNCYNHNTQLNIIDGPLPVVLTDFDAVKADKQIALEWATALEINNSYFEVQHSVEGSLWRDIGTIVGTGYSAEARRYRFVHEQPAPGANYYRLRQVDFDGKSTYSNVVKVDLRGARDIVLAPNPVKDGAFTLRRSHNAAEEILDIALFNALGRLARRWSWDAEGGDARSFDISDLPAGLYMLKATGVAPIVLVKE